ncbi:MAG: GNAT family N-acetyltransferase [Caulobacterales bacterium]|nr:GNAT family N-acetyltransferase [Caulobacterales bacterium]
MAVTRAPVRATGWDRIEGDGVTLRRPQPGDFEEWARVRGVSRPFLVPWEPSWAFDELSRSGYRRRLRRYAKDAREGSGAPFFVYRHQDGALVGGCNLNNIRRGVLQSASVGYWVGEPFRRRGHTAAAVRAVLRFAFDTLALHRVEAACIPCNDPSRRLLESVGFRQEGVARAYLKINGAWRDHVLYAIIRGDQIR